MRLPGFSKIRTQRQADPPQVNIVDDVVRSGGIGVVKGGINTLGMGGDAREGVRSAVDWVASKFATPTLNDLITGNESRRTAAGEFAANLLTKLPTVGPFFMGPTSEQIQHGVESVTGEFYKPKTTAGEFAQTGGEFAGALLGNRAGLLRRGAQWVGSTLGAEGAGRLADALDLPGLVPYARMFGGVAGGFLPSAVPRRAAPSASPSASHMNVGEEPMPSSSEGRSAGVTLPEQAPGARVLEVPADSVSAGAPEIRAAVSSELYNPPRVRARPFSRDYPPADYPRGVPQDATGRLTHDIEGRPLYAKNVVGRNEAGKPDVPLPRSEYDLVIQDITGQPTQWRSPAQMGNDLGRTTLDVHGHPELVELRNDFLPGHGNRVQGHELGHVIEDAVRTVPTTGLEHELVPMFNTLNNPLRTPNGLNAHPRAQPFTPQHQGYSDAEAPREYMAEAIRAYLTSPNWLKSVAPQTAARIREFVNSHAQLSKIIQFNALAGVAAMNALGAATPKQSEPDL